MDKWVTNNFRQAEKEKTHLEKKQEMPACSYPTYYKLGTTIS